MAKNYVYVLAAWLRCNVARVDLPLEHTSESNPDEAPGEIADELREYLEEECQVFKLELIDGDNEDDQECDELEVSLQLQVTFDETQMENIEHYPSPTDEAVRQLEQTLRAHLEARYRVNYWDILDDAGTTFLLDVCEDDVTSPDDCHDDDCSAVALPTSAFTWFDDSDWEVVAVAQDFARLLLRQDRIQPRAVIAIGRALHAIGRLPLSTTGVDVTFGISVKHGDHADWTESTWLVKINSERFAVSSGGSTWNEQVGGDSISGYLYERECTGHRDFNDCIQSWQNEVKSNLTDDFEIYVSDESTMNDLDAEVASLEILPHLRGKFPNQLRPSIQSVKMIHDGGHCFLQTRMAERVEGQLDSVATKTEDLSFIGCEGMPDGLLFSPELTVEQNAKRFLEEFDEIGIINCTDLFTDEAAQQINANVLRPHGHLAQQAVQPDTGKGGDSGLASD